MKKLRLFLCFASILATSCHPPKVRIYNEGIHITPVPLEVIPGEGAFHLNATTAFVCEGNGAESVAEFFRKKIAASTGYNLCINGAPVSKNYIALSIEEVSMGDEGYLLEVTPVFVSVKANTPQGIFYGMQTVMQLLPAEIESKTMVRGIAWSMPAVSVRDEPRLPYRGFLQDVCRHFVDIEHLKKQIDVLAMYKMNRFHWHLTEDQGWRIEIKRYPRLTGIGARRTEGEGHTYGPYYYTQEEVKELVAYARERFVEVIPEIEMPGHSIAALSAYPEYSCTGGPFEVRNQWGIANDILCAGNEETFTFLFNILEEVIPLFESDYFHVGGDEAPKRRWEACPKCQARIRQLGLKDDAEFTAEERLQSYFIRRAEAFLASHGRKLIGWDEILEGGLAPTATVMSWRNEEGGIKAATMGRDVIMTPHEWLYLYNYQGDQKILPLCNRHYVPLSKVYAYDPVPAALDDDKKHHVLGVQTCSWSEYMYTPDLVEWCVNPRLTAVAEAGWSTPAKRNYDDFLRRLENQRVRLDMHGINYYIPVPQDAGVPSCNHIAFTEQATVAFETTEPVRIVYTTDGREPGLRSKEYTGPLTFTETTTLRARSLLASGKLGEVRTITIEKQVYAPAVEIPPDTPTGIRAEYYRGVMHNVSELEGRIPDEIEYVETPQESKYTLFRGYREDAHDSQHWNTVLTGYITLPEAGIYYFSTEAEQMWLDGKLFISNTGEVKRHPRSDRSVALAQGVHEVKLIRLCGITGGWSPLWLPPQISVRKADEETFRLMEKQDYL